MSKVTQNQGEVAEQYWFYFHGFLLMWNLQIDAFIFLTLHF